jgi:hypothetical protein
MEYIDIAFEEENMGEPIYDKEYVSTNYGESLVVRTLEEACTHQ